MNYRKIKRLRESLELSQQQAADAAGLKSRQHWNNVESGRATNINVELLERIAKVLKVEAGELLK